MPTAVGADRAPRWQSDAHRAEHAERRGAPDGERHHAARQAVNKRREQRSGLRQEGTSCGTSMLQPYGLHQTPTVLHRASTTSRSFLTRRKSACTPSGLLVLSVPSTP